MTKQHKSMKCTKVCDLETRDIYHHNHHHNGLEVIHGDFVHQQLIHITPAASGACIRRCVLGVHLSAARGAYITLQSSADDY